MLLKAGMRLKSAVCQTQVIVVKAPDADVEISCGGVPLVPMDAEGGASLVAGHEGPTQLGKRYADEAVGIELLCTKAGDGALYLNGSPLGLKEAKALPSSD
jgi:hypothetical protein